MAAHDPISPACALASSAARLPARADGLAMALRLRAIALAREPATLAEALLEACKDLLGGIEGLVLLTLPPESGVRAISGLEPALGEQLLTWLTEAPNQANSAYVPAATLPPWLRAELAAQGGQALLRLPLNNTAERVGWALLLLSQPVGLTPTLLQSLGEQTRMAAATLQTLAERQALLAQNEKLVEELTALRKQLAAAEETQSQSEALIHALQQQLQQRRGRDALTGLISGRHFHSRLEIEVQRARRYRDELGLLLIDIDDFRRFNQSYGHVEGDKALARLGAILRQELRMIDHGFRYGGEEFTAILPHCGQAALLKLAERLRQRVASERFQVEGQLVRLTISIGAAVYRQGVLIESFIRNVDDALYQAKAQGRNQVVLVCAEPR